MKFILILFLFTITADLFAQSIEEVRVYKTDHRMDLLSHGKILKTFRVMLGRGGKLPKEKEGDLKVPEGQYLLDYKNESSLFYKAIHINYPNLEDQRRASEQGVDPGGDIMIHGYPNYPKPLFKFLKRMGLIKFVDWTAGCIAVDNSEMDEIFSHIEVPLPITIFH